LITQKEITEMHWLEKRLVMMIATLYATAMARAIAALPHDDPRRCLTQMDDPRGHVPERPRQSFFGL
jgi:hypothetical protein